MTNTSNPDAAILAMELKVRTLIEQFNRACSECGEDEATGATWAAAFDALDTLMEMRATTLDGIAAKVRIADLDIEYTQERLSASILADLLAMEGGRPMLPSRDGNQQWRYTDVAAA